MRLLLAGIDFQMVHGMQDSTDPSGLDTPLADVTDSDELAAMSKGVKVGTAGGRFEAL
jgi:hypothetical protein